MPEWIIALLSATVGLIGGVAAAVAGPWVGARHADREWQRDRRAEAISEFNQAAFDCYSWLVSTNFAQLVQATAERATPSLSARMQRLLNAQSNLRLYCSEETCAIGKEVGAGLVELQKVRSNERLAAAKPLVDVLKRFREAGREEVRLRKA